MAATPRRSLVRVAVVILTYNGRHLIDGCLAAVRANTDLAQAEVVVVDNASTDGSADHVARAHAWVRLLRNRENLGFAGGVDTALAAVDADAYVLLNTDAQVTPGWLDRLVATAQATGAGIVGALEVDEAGKPRWGPDLPPVAERVPEERDVVSFACALIRREVVRRIGYLDHGFFMYHEDWDYCHRARAAGFRVVFDAAAVVIHPGAGSFNAQVPAWKARIRTASRMRYQAMHWTLWRRLQSAFREPLVAGYWAKQGLLVPYLQGRADAWRARPGMRRHRADPTGYVAWGDPPLHVAMALPWPAWLPTGGAERHVHELAGALVGMGVRVTVIAPGPAEVPAGLPYAVHLVQGRAHDGWQALRKRLGVGATVARRRADAAFNRLAERAARRMRADVLHRHFVHDNAFRPALPLVYTLHNGDLPRDDAGAAGRLAQADVRMREAGLAQGLRDADRLVCVSEHVASSVPGRLGVDQPVDVVHNGCGLAAPTVTKAEARRRLGVGHGTVVLFVGRLWRHKRVLRLLPLLDEPGVHLVLLGRGEHEDELRARAAAEPRLHVPGFVGEDEKALWLRAADVLALPSGTFEGNPLVMLEALRSGTPVFGTTAAWLQPDLREFGRFGEDVQLALEAARIDASAAVARVPGWDAVARETLAVYRGAVEAFRAKR